MISPGGQHKHITSSMEQRGRRSVQTSPHIEVVLKRPTELNYWTGALLCEEASLQ